MWTTPPPRLCRSLFSTPWRPISANNTATRPASFIPSGAAAGDALAAAREKVARALGCDTGEVFFTSCGSEADNWAIKGTAHKFAKQGKKHLITSCIEHHAVLHSMQALEREGFEVTYLPVDAEGFVSPADVEAAIRPDTALVTIMFANNEIGTIEPIEEIGAVCRKHGVWFHTDAVQAVGAVPIDCHALPVDMLSLSAHKFNGPKGVGALYIRRGVMPLNFLDGGAQERGRRAGTENLAGIVGLATALEAAVNSLDEKRARLARMRDYVLEHIQKMPQVKVNGPLDGSKRLPNNVNAKLHRGRGRKPAAHAGHARRLCLLRLGMRLRQLGPQPRAAFHRPAPRDRSLQPAHQLRRAEHDGRREGRVRRAG